MLAGTSGKHENLDDINVHEFENDLFLVTSGLIFVKIDIYIGFKQPYFVQNIEP